MKRNWLIGGVVAAIVLVGVAALALYNYVLGPTLAASGPLTAIPVVVATKTPTPAGAATSVPQATPSAADPQATAALEATEASAPNDGTLIFTIDQSRSEVRFILSEVLSGNPTTVVGASNQVAGQIAVNPSDLSTAQVGVIQVNARTLETDRSQRNNAIRNRILHTDTYEFITFTPTEVRGLSGAANPGDSFTFQIAGDLTIQAVTQPVVFEVTVTADSATQISGSATTTVLRSDYGLQIPSVPQVADVSEEVTLEIDFVAAPAS
ncbi:MAG: YceI family protein [Anaerolineales bacterium]|nr:YceI family protein [Anaerolineales bacterium]